MCPYTNYNFTQSILGNSMSLGENASIQWEKQTMHPVNIGQSTLLFYSNDIWLFIINREHYY
jgi:hypothetical protein